MNIFKKVPYIEQMQQTECGLCCIAMILQYYGSNETLGMIRESLEVGRDGTQFSQLQGYMEDKGFVTKIYRCESETISQINLPAIACWTNRQYVVIEKADKNKVRIVDPEYGSITLSMDEFDSFYSGILMTMEPTKLFVKYKERNNSWRSIFNELKGKKKLLIKTLGISLIAYGIQMMAPVFIQAVVDTLIGSKIELGLKICMLMLGGILLIYGISSFLQQLTLVDLQLEIDRTITKGTIRKLLRLPYSYFENRSNGDLLYRLSSIEVIRSLLSDHIIYGVIQFGYAIAIMCYIFSKSWLLALVTVGFFIMNGLFILVMRNKIMEENKLQIIENTKLNEIQTETIYSIFSIKSSGIESDIWNNWKHRYGRSLNAYKKKNTILNLYSTVMAFFQMIGPLVVLLVGIQQNMYGKMTIGECIACYSLACSFIATSLALFNLWNDYSLANTYLERLQDITLEKEEIINEDAIDIIPKGNIEFRNVSFAYTKFSEPVIKNLSFKIQKGTKFAIVGTSGSGKSTITKLLLGLYKPTSGEILYDGINLNNINQKELRKKLGVVPQDMSLFNKTIAENIALNVADYNMEDVIAAAKAAHIHDEIEEMPMKYRTLISDMGGNLSGGQRQRIVLARAIMNESDIMILDEATSSLDNVNEKKVFECLKKNNKTQIIIAHRMSTIVDADTIMVLENGEKVESGTHDELMKKNGIYASLYKSKEMKSA